MKPTPSNPADGSALESAATPSVHVPGARAPSCNILSFWNSMMRWMLRTRGSLSSFLRSMIGLAPSVQDGSTSLLWPMPLPYPRWLAPQSNHLCGRVRMCREKAVNLVVATLSWLALGRTAKAPASLWVGKPLTAQQRKVVARLEHYLGELEHSGDIGPEQMGRTAAKVESLDQQIRELHEEACRIAAVGYSNIGPRRGRKAEHVFRSASDFDADGAVVGHLGKREFVVAKEIEPSRLSVPLEPPQFRAEDLFDEPHRSVFEDPISQARDPSSSACVPPRVRLHASRRRAFEFLHFLDQRHRLLFAPESKVRSTHLCGGFALIKDQQKDRLILDARPPNTLEDAMVEWTQTLGSVTALVSIELQPGHTLKLSGTDLCDYYYCYRVSKLRSYRNALAFPLTPQQASAFKCFDESLWQHARLYPCMSTLAMGDNQAVELGQCAHIKLGFISQAFTPDELLTVHGRAPRGKVSCGIMIDDVLICEQVPMNHVSEYTDGERRLDLLCEEYAQRGLTAHPRKTFRAQDKCESWGVAIDGSLGLVRAAPRRLVPMMMLTARVALLGFASVSLLQVLCGSWISILQVRRRMLCLVEELYHEQRGRDESAVVQLSPAAVAELWSLCSLGPIAVADLRAESLPELYLSDASDWGTASVKTSVSRTFTQELQRHCLSRGVWGKLLSPWKSWLKQHQLLEEEDELPGAPLVSHPLWLQVAENLPFRLNHKKASRSKKHINLLELQSILEVETKLADRRQCCRYALGADSQVALAVITKGRSSSSSLNHLLRRSLPTVLGSGIYGCYGFVPSLANVSDDPTREQPIRKPQRDPPQFLAEALSGNFAALDVWLSELGFSPMQVAGVPFASRASDDLGVFRDQLLQRLRAVQKSDRLVEFERARTAPVSPFVAAEQDHRDPTRGQKQEPDGQTKILEKRQKSRSFREKPTGKAVSFVSEQVAPPACKPRTTPKDVGKFLGRPEDGSTVPSRRRGGRRRRPGFVEDDQLPALPAAARDLLQSLAPQQFLLPGGSRAFSPVAFRRKGVLDLYSGKAGVAKELANLYGCWVLTFDYTHGDDQNLLDPDIQKRVFDLVAAGAFWCFGAAPECASFSRAITPAVRTRAQPAGIQGLSANMQLKVARGNQHASFILSTLLACLLQSMVYWIENPDGSFLWLQDAWLRSGYARHECSYRFDMCRFRTPWRKRTRILTNCGLAGLRELCLGGHSHQVLRGRSKAHQDNWTHVAQVYPRGLCRRLAVELGKSFGLQPLRARLNTSACARADHSRIGEASHPGPARRAPRNERSAADLLAVPMLEPVTVKLQQRVWDNFEQWLFLHLSEDSVGQVFLCPSLAAHVLRSYGLHLYSAGFPMYELRHLLVVVQHRFPAVKPSLSPAWDILGRWEEIKPVRHRLPLPELLFRAMFVVALYWKWRRWGATLLLGYEGIARIGEVLSARRADLVLPSDMFECGHRAAFLRIRKPKSKRRGKGRVQHLKIDNGTAVDFLESVFAGLDEFLALFPLSATVFRSKWDRILQFLQVPKRFRPTPSSIRGGGAILAYRRGESIQSILWRMRLMNQQTLESYLQELAAESVLLQLPEAAKSRIRFCASFFDSALKSPG